jgi:D-arabinose 1-dehydrogenase-like Zn-dependent alcohol dehydrogenase
VETIKSKDRVFAKAMGADKVVAISRKMGKKEDSLKMGADLYIASSGRPTCTKDPPVFSRPR